MAKRIVPTGINLNTGGPLEVGTAGLVIGTLSTVDADPTATFTYSTSVPGFVITGSQLALAADNRLVNASAPLIVTVTTTDQAGQSYTKALHIALGRLMYTESQDLAGTDYTGQHSGAYGTFSGYGTGTWAAGTSYRVITAIGSAGGSASASMAPLALVGSSLADIVTIHETATGGGGISGGTPINPGATVSIPAFQDRYSVPTGFLGIFGGAGGAATASGMGGSIALGTGNDLASLYFAASGGRGGDGGNGEAAVTIFQGTGPYALRYDLAPGNGGTGGAGGNATVAANGYALSAGGTINSVIFASAVAGNGGDGGNKGNGGNGTIGFAQVGAGGAGGVAHGNVDNNQFIAARPGADDGFGLHLTVTGGDAGADGSTGLTDHPQGAAAKVAGSAVGSLSDNVISTGSGNDRVSLTAHVASGHGAGGTASLAMTLNVVSLGAGNDTLTLDVSLQVNGASSFTAGGFNFSWNQFDGGTGFDVLDLSHFTAPQGLTVDLALGKLFVTGQPGNASQVTGFEKVIGSSGDLFIDAKGAQVYTGGDHAQFSFASGHGADIITDFGNTDQMIFKGYGTRFHTAAQLTAAMTENVLVTAADGQNYFGVKIATPDGGSVLLAGAHMADLVAHLASDFLFA